MSKRSSHQHVTSLKLTYVYRALGSSVTVSALTSSRVADTERARPGRRLLTNNRSTYDLEFVDAFLLLRFVIYKIIGVLTGVSNVCGVYELITYAQYRHALYMTLFI